MKAGPTFDSTLKMAATCSSKTSVEFQRNVQIPENRTLVNILSMTEFLGVCSQWLLLASGLSDVHTASTFSAKICRQHNLYDIIESMSHE